MLENIPYATLHKAAHLTNLNALKDFTFNFHRYVDSTEEPKLFATAIMPNNVDSYRNILASLAALAFAPTKESALHSKEAAISFSVNNEIPTYGSVEALKQKYPTSLPSGKPAVVTFNQAALEKLIELNATIPALTEFMNNAGIKPSGFAESLKRR